MPEWASKSAFVALMAGCVASGWVARGWHQDSLELVAERSAIAATAAQAAVQAEHAQRFESFLRENAKHVTRIEKESIKLVDRPVYRNICIDDDGLRIINAAKNGTDPGKP